MCSVSKTDSRICQLQNRSFPIYSCRCFSYFVKAIFGRFRLRLYSERSRNSPCPLSSHEAPGCIGDQTKQAPHADALVRGIQTQAHVWIGSMAPVHTCPSMSLGAREGPWQLSGADRNSRSVSLQCLLCPPAAIGIAVVNGCKQPEADCNRARWAAQPQKSLPVQSTGRLCRGAAVAAFTSRRRRAQSQSHRGWWCCLP